MSEFRKKIIYKTLLVLEILFALGLLSLFINTNDINNIFVDSLFTRNEPSNEIVIIAIDDASTDLKPMGLGKFSSWDRSNFSKLIEKLSSARVIGLDFIFATTTDSIHTDYIKKLDYDLSKSQEYEPIVDKFINDYVKETPNIIDQNFVESLKNSKNIVIAESYSDEENKLIRPLSIYQDVSDQGYLNLIFDSKGIIREFVPQYENETHFDIALINKYDNSIKIPENKTLINYFAEPKNYENISLKPSENETLINDSDKTKGFKSIPFIDIINGDFDPKDIEDKIVLVGTTSSKEIHDEYPTPKSNTNYMPGVEVHANILQTILEGKYITNQSTFSQILTILALTIILSLAFTYFGITISTILLFLALVGYYGSAHIAYRKGLILNMVYPLLAIIFTYIAAWIYRYFVADKGKREIKSAFGHYVSKELVDEIAKNPEMVKLGGEQRLITVFFSDIKSSTTYSEQVPIEQWVAQINEYFTIMEAVIQKHGGTIDKYEGDALMGFWGAPVNQSDHVARAYSAVLEMQRVLKSLHSKWEKENKPLIEFRIGVNTGTAIVGNFGSKNRFDYTAMGDTVNTASRLESSANKTYGTIICVAGFDNNLSPEDKQKFIFRELDKVFLPGKNEASVLYELVARTSDSTPELQTTLTTYAKGLVAYRNKNFQLAVDLFKTLPNDNPAKVMLARSQTLLTGQKIPELDEQMQFRIMNK